MTDLMAEIEAKFLALNPEERAELMSSLVQPGARRWHAPVTFDVRPQEFLQCWAISYS